MFCPDFSKNALENGPIAKVVIKAESLSSKPASRAICGSISKHAAATTKTLSLTPRFPGVIDRIKLKLMAD